MKKRFAMLAVLVCGFCSTPSWALWTHFLTAPSVWGGQQCFYYQMDTHASTYGHIAYLLIPQNGTCPDTYKTQYGLTFL